MPASTSSQKWFAVAMTENHTHAGQRSHRTFHGQRRTTEARTTPTIGASAVCRRGIAAYGFAARLIGPLPWLSPPIWPSVFVKPTDVKNRGGAVGSSTKPIKPRTFASRMVLRNPVNAGVLRKETHSHARPRTAHSEV